MRCDNCKKREHVIELTQVEHDTKVTLHLCEPCAQERGIDTGSAVLKTPLGTFLSALGKEATLPVPTDGLRCATCAATLRDVRDSGRLGCAQCYQLFEHHLRDLLRRLHGSSQHMGERYLPPGGAGQTDATGWLLDLRDKLRRAVESENFELAAELRDRIRVLE